MPNRRLIFPAVLLITLLLHADDAPAPTMKSPVAIAAMKKHDLAASKAKAEYSRAMKAAEKQLITEFDVAEKDAVKAGSLDDALAIRAAKKDAEARLGEVPEGGSVPRTSIVKEITGTDWRYSGGGNLHYGAGGLLTGDAWSKPMKWEADGENSVIQTDPGGADIRVTFTADRKACIWQYLNHGKQAEGVNTCTRISH